MKRSRMVLVFALIAPALASGCRQSRGSVGDGGSFPPPMMGAMAPTKERQVTILPPDDVLASHALPQ